MGCASHIHFIIEVNTVKQGVNKIRGADSTGGRRGMQSHRLSFQRSEQTALRSLLLIPSTAR